MDIHTVIKKFLELRGAIAGKGIKHPSHPSSGLAEITKRFLSQYPFLQKDREYVDFLESYGGAFLYWPDEDLTIDIFGLSHVSTNFMGEEVKFVTDDGFLIICDILVRVGEGHDLESDYVSYGFSFDTTQARRWGIYRHLPNKPTEWYCETFIELLSELIAEKGRLFD